MAEALISVELLVRRCSKCLVIVCGSLVWLAALVATAADPLAVSFDRDVAPLLARRCLDCHNGTEKKGGFDLSRVEAATKGGESGAARAA